jgi:hypothetical protein
VRPRSALGGSGAGETGAPVHRGEHEPDGLPAADHLHAERRDLPHLRGALDEFGPEALVDACAMTAADFAADDRALAAAPC